MTILRDENAEAESLCNHFSEIKRYMEVARRYFSKMTQGSRVEFQLSAGKRSLGCNGSNLKLCIAYVQWFRTVEQQLCKDLAPRA